MRRTRDLDKINEMLHFLKATGPFHNYAVKLTASHNKCRALNNRKRINPDIYKSDLSLVTFFHWVEKYILCCHFLDYNRYYVDQMREILTILQSPETLGIPEKYFEIVARLLSSIQFADRKIQPKLNRFSCTECIRLDEALVCFENYSFYACVIMAVSAVEQRLLELLRKTNETIFNDLFIDCTLGQLIQVFEPDKYTDEKFKSIKDLIPDKHRPLLSLLNHYRIFSAHPKEEKITAQVADSIVSLAFIFMLDKKTCPYKEKELECE